MLSSARFSLSALVFQSFRLFSPRVDFRCSARLPFFVRYLLPFSDSGPERERGEKMVVTRGKRGVESTCVASSHKSAITKPATAISKQLPFLVINSPNSWPQHQLECLEHGHFLLRWFSLRFRPVSLAWLPLRFLSANDRRRSLLNRHGRFLTRRCVRYSSWNGRIGYIWWLEGKKSVLLWGIFNPLAKIRASCRILFIYLFTVTIAFRLRMDSGLHCNCLLLSYLLIYQLSNIELLVSFLKCHRT